MNYRHHFHAGNFADVMKHALLVALVRALQRKEKGFLFLDTHAGRGRYDLELAAAGESLARKPEWPEGIGRIWDKEAPPVALSEYLELVREFDRQQGNLTVTPRFYPGSPALARMLLRPVDRMVCCEKHPAECAALEAALGGGERLEVRESDGYAAIRACLPPRERRALVLLDPPYEAADEFAQMVGALRAALRRLASGVLAAWYPLTERARVEEFLLAVRTLNPPPSLLVELAVAGEAASQKMKGCGLLVINPPWQFDIQAREMIAFLTQALAQAPGGGGRVEWVVPPT